MLQCWFPILLSLCWSALSIAAPSQTGHTAILWEAPEGCPSASDVVRLVEERLGQSVDAPREQSLRLHARVEHASTGDYELLLSTEGATGMGQRRLSNPDCTRLSEAAAFVMALAIDPKLVDVRAPDQEGVVVGSTAPALHSEPIAISQGQHAAPNHEPPWRSAVMRLGGRVILRAPTLRAATRIRWRATAQIELGSGLLPHSDVSLAGNLGMSPLRGFELRLGARGYLPREAGVLDGPGTISLSAGLGHVGVCGLPTSDPWRVHVCMGADFGALHADGKKLNHLRSQTAPYAAAVLEAGLSYRGSIGWGIVVSAAAGLGVSRPRFGVSSDQQPVEVYRPDAGVFRFALGAFWAPN